MNMTSADVRTKLVHALDLDLVGPGCDDTELHAEILPQAPSRWYVTGFLVPTDAKPEDKSDDAGDEGSDELGTGGGADDEATPEPAAARKAYFQSSMGLSLLVPKEAKELRVRVRWGDYLPVGADGLDDLIQPQLLAERVGQGRGGNFQFAQWRRMERSEVVPLTLSGKGPWPKEELVPNSGTGKHGLYVALVVRPVKDIPQFAEVMRPGARSVSVFLVNRRVPLGEEVRDGAWAFQATLEVTCEVPFVARPNVRGLELHDWDERVADLQYHDAYEYAVGHGVSTHAALDADGECREVHTRWLPSAEVERVAPADIPGVELRMEELAGTTDPAVLTAKLSPLVGEYKAWVEQQRGNVPAKPKNRKEIANELLKDALRAADRIGKGIALLTDPVVLEAFRTANRVMGASDRRRKLIRGVKPEDLKPPTWRPFQLAFLLMNLEGVVKPDSPERETVDLLFFPTGGGKTEAYLGLAAFTLVYRRLVHPGVHGAGLSVLMRYTLRLLTLDQLGRAATLICALELERRGRTDLGEWPFEIGLWVGRGATPNEMGRKGHKNPEHTARQKVLNHQGPKRGPTPIPLEDCPWCGTRFKPSSFVLQPNVDHPTDLRVVCANDKCEFTRNSPLPVLTVDEPIYRRLPCFLIATVDKFAALPWTGPVGGFFGRVERFDKEGFYGPCAPNVGRLIPDGALPPPDLIIQDELHLISGPMGTMVGLYEAAVEELCVREVSGKRVKPKIIASTATVRRAQNQIRALFGRNDVSVFPPPGPDRRNSFFARTQTTTESPARQYLGVAAQGVSPKKLLLRVYLALLATAQKWHDAAGGSKTPANPADPYMTLLGYFGSLRELGGSRRIIEDEVVTKVTGYAGRKRVNESDGLFADRQIDFEPVELTSRVSTADVAAAKERLARGFDQDGAVDVAIATNMISVGLDISRLGLMVVLGQPKTAAEYIQATSRVGRDVEGKPTDRPGLVITIMNVHRPRDRSHYERFAAFHQTFYRSVEATSVTPFSPRALDRGLAATVVGLARQRQRPLTAPKGATDILRERGRLDWVADALSQRAAMMPGGWQQDTEEVRKRTLERVKELLDAWERIAKGYTDVGAQLQYQQEEGDARPLLYTFLDPELRKLPEVHRRFRANRSMRDVEPSVNLHVWTLDNIELTEDEG